MNRFKVQKMSKKKGLKRHKTSKRKKQNDSSGDESMDLTQKIYPIAHYMDNRQEMIEQVFSVMEQEKLNCMLPPILKGMSISLLKEKCLQELTNMSHDDIHKVLCGEPLQTLSEKALTVPEPNSDSCESISSLEECSNQEQEKRTLLDILEQEMQAIAYQTVMNKEGNSLSSSSDDLLEIIPIPVDPESKKIDASSVPLVCIDSEEDDAPASASVPPPFIDISAELSVGKDSNAAEALELSRTSDCTIPTDTTEKNQICSENDTFNRNDKETTSNLSKGTDHGHQTSIKPHERILVQVFPKKTNTSERVVKKIFRTGCNEKGEDKVCTPISEHPSDSTSIICRTQTPQETDEKKSDCYMLSGNKETQEDGVTIEIREESLSYETATSLSEQNCQLDSAVRHSNGSCDNSLISHPTVEAEVEQEKMGDLCKEDVDCMVCQEEKEEGEITEAESEEDFAVLETVPDRRRSPTIFLSSDSNDVNSDLDQNKSRARHRKHHHRQKRNKRSGERSPERSRRRIERRGNRSYRRKTTSSSHANLKSTEEEKERANYVSEPISVENLENLKSIQVGTEETNTVSASSSAEKLHLEAVATETNALETNKETRKVNECIECTEQTEETRENKESVDAFSNFEGNKIDSSDETEGPEDADPLSDKTSWADRWAKKKDLKKVVITSKICRNVRKRILSARKKQISQETSLQSPSLPPVPPLVLHVEGSVQEYQMLQLLVDDVCETAQVTGTEGETTIDSSDVNLNQASDAEFKDIDVTEVINSTSSNEQCSNSSSAHDRPFKTDVGNQEPQNEMECI